MGVSVEAVVDQRVGVSVRARLVFTAARLMLRPLLTYWPLTGWGMWPLPLIESAAGLLPAPRGARFDPVDFGGYGGEWVRVDSAADLGADPGADAAVDGDAVIDPGPDRAGLVLYFHGGGFVTCGVATHRYAVAMLAEETGLPVLSVAYRQLPTVRLSGSVEDCLAVYRRLLADGHDAGRIVFAGDSAGGHLAFATALAAKAEGLPGPAGIVALSPWLDFDSATKLAHPNADRDAYAPVTRLPALARLLGADPALDPTCSPVNSDLSGLPPVLLIAAEGEMLRCDAELMADRLAAAGVPCTLEIWEGQVHAFPVLAPLIPEAKAAITDIAAFVRGRVGTAATTDLTALAG